MLAVSAERTVAFSGLEHFDPAGLFDALSTGIIVLDQHLCAIYANIVAQRLCRFSLSGARGRPIEEVIGPAHGFVPAMRDALAAGERRAHQAFAVWPACLRGQLGRFEMTARIIVGEVTGPHLLLELEPQ